MNAKMLFLSAVSVVLIILISSISLLYTNNGEPSTIVSQYGNPIEIYGDGIYKNDSAFLAPIFKGTDLIMLIVTAPLATWFILEHKRKKSFASALNLASVNFVIFYYAVSLSFGVIYNALHLLYIVLLSTSFFSILLGFIHIQNTYLKTYTPCFYPSKGLNAFLIISATALFVAWLPDIIVSLINQKPLSYLENYTTSVTNVLDMGFISPLLFLSVYLLKKHNFYGVYLLACLLFLSSLIGIILPSQTIFQIANGINIPFGELITKVAIFVVLSAIAFYYRRRLFKSLKPETYYFEE